MFASCDSRKQTIRWPVWLLCSQKPQESPAVFDSPRYLDGFSFPCYSSPRTKLAVMPHPGHRRTSSHKRRRAAHFALEKVTFAVCAKCKSAVLPHHACGVCGTYNGRQAKDMGRTVARTVKKTQMRAAAAAPAHDHEHDHDEKSEEAEKKPAAKKAKKKSAKE